MHLGYFSLNTAEGVRPDVLAAELEHRGFDSIWIPEHSHIPVVREPTPVFGPDIPDGYKHLMDPFVSLAAASAATSTLLLGTGVSMVLEHDVLDLACRVATLDVLTGGRVRFGVGVGWLPEELHNHRPDVAFRSRYSATAERIRALRTAWTNDEAEFVGKWDRYDRSWVYPKPIQRPLPVAFGSSGLVGMRIAAELADEWHPIDVALGQFGGIAQGIDVFRKLVAEAGRDPDSVPITMYAWGWEPGQPPVDAIARYEDYGVARVVVCPSSIERHSADVTMRRLDEFASLIA